MKKINILLAVITISGPPTAYFSYKGAANTEHLIIKQIKEAEKTISNLLSVEGGKDEIKIDEQTESLPKEHQAKSDISTSVFDEFANDICDSEFGPTDVKYDRSYTLSQKMNNYSDKEIYLHKYSVQYVNGQNFNAGGQWAWTQKLKDQSYSVGPNQSIKYIETGSPWLIDQKPSELDLDWDFGVVTSIMYDFVNDTSDDASRINFTSCIRYKIVE